MDRSSLTDEDLLKRAALQASNPSDDSAAGSGGGGVVVLAAPDGVFFSGRAVLGRDGKAIVYSEVFEPSALANATKRPFQVWKNLPNKRFVLFGGSGRGGQGGDGHLLLPGEKPKRAAKEPPVLQSRHDR